MTIAPAHPLQTLAWAVAADPEAWDPTPWDDDPEADAMLAAWEATLASLRLVTNRHGVTTAHYAGCPQLQFAPEVRRFVATDVRHMRRCGTCDPAVAEMVAACTPYRNEHGYGWTHRDSRGRFAPAPVPQEAVMAWIETEGVSHSRPTCSEIGRDDVITGSDAPHGWLCGTCVEVTVAPWQMATNNWERWGEQRCVGSCGTIHPVTHFPKHADPLVSRKQVCKTCRGEGVDGRAYAEVMEARAEAAMDPRAEGTETRKVRDLA